MFLPLYLLSNLLLVTAMYRQLLKDFWSEFPVRNFVIDPEYDEKRPSVPTRMSCPTLESNRHWLFDLSRDSSERLNLAETMPERVRSMHKRFCSILSQSKANIIAGDSNLAEDFESFGPRSCGPFLSDDAEVSSAYRFFPTLASKLLRLAVLILAICVVSTLCCVRFLFSRCCRRRGDVLVDKEKKRK